MGGFLSGKCGYDAGDRRTEEYVVEGTKKGYSVVEYPFFANNDICFLFGEKVFTLIKIEFLFLLEKSGQCSYSTVLTICF